MSNIHGEQLNQKCYINNIQTLDDFYIQMEDNYDNLLKIDISLNSMLEKQFQVLERKKAKGTKKYNAYYDHDGYYYRVKIERFNTMNPSFATVTSVDYGLEFETEKLYELPPEIEEINSLNIHCMLKKPDNIKSWSSEALQRFHEISNNGATDFFVHFINKNDRISCVDLFKDNEKISTLLSGLCKQTKLEQTGNFIFKINFSALTFNYFSAYT